ncbi:sugar ABC transporter substrate-binding protein [Niallia sp. NCCP-28]|uniref:sugar ABC transporter substrate-binding protein n=1 Tax=Niallia sp. NCCP-28 TaxID=2934712 RepID=UPI00208B4812|nr:sugar ABC transporter substrate-binding protein [Niallia sp. NCCP-28]GKU82720.1 ribose import binding protein RbsB [Niallia sp. NCCP-28]
MKKIWYIPLILLISSITLVGCGNNATESQSGNASGGGKGNDGELEVGVVLKALNSDHWKFVEAGAKAAGEKYGVKVNVLGPPAETQFLEQVSMMEDQLTQGVDALLVAPSQPASAKPTFEQAKALGIPVLLLDTDADFKDKVSFIGTGNYEAGRLGAEFIAKQVEKGDTVAIIRGAKGDNTHDDRAKGAEEVLKEQGIKVIIQPADSDRAKGASVMENILTAHSNIAAVYATNEEMALGALRTVQDKNKDVLVIGFDGTPEGLESVENGGLTATVAQDPYMIGYLGVESAYQNANGEKVEKRIDSGAEVITKETVKAKIAKLNERLEGK